VDDELRSKMRREEEEKRRRRGRAYQKDWAQYE